MCEDLTVRIYLALQLTKVTIKFTYMRTTASVNGEPLTYVCQLLRAVGANASCPPYFFDYIPMPLSSRLMRRFESLALMSDNCLKSRSFE